MTKITQDYITQIKALHDKMYGVIADTIYGDKNFNKKEFDKDFEQNTLDIRERESLKYFLR